MEEQIDFFKNLGIEDNKLEKQVKVKVITTEKLEEMILSYKQLVVMLEALHNYKIDVEKLEEENETFMHQYKLNEIKEIFQYIEQGVKYDFQNAVNKCHNRHLKRLNEDDPGMETFGWIVESKKS